MSWSSLVLMAYLFYTFAMYRFCRIIIPDISRGIVRIEQFIMLRFEVTTAVFFYFASKIPME